MPIFLYLIIELALFISFEAFANNDISKPPWINNTLGTDEIVLPGFSSITVNGTILTLGGGRKYIWSNSFLPTQIYSKGQPYIASQNLILKLNGKQYTLFPDITFIQSKSAHHVEIKSVGLINSNIKITVFTRIEYDGLATVKLTLTPQQPLLIDSFEYTVSLQNNSSLKMISYQEKTIRKFQKEIVSDPDYIGNFLNVVAFPDGERSFWWFADNAENWILGKKFVTEVKQQSNYIKLIQRIIGKETLLNHSLTVKFNFLVTPIKNPKGKWRKQRIAANLSKDETKLGKINLWWTNVFSHEDLPYTEYPGKIKAKLPKKDIDAYPGLIENRRLLSVYKKQGILRLPYFSGHALSELDPVFEKYRQVWEVEPTYIIPAGSDLPYTAKLEKSWLSHRAKNYTNYLIYRFDKLIDELGFDGLYFDQANVIDSMNPHHGLWKDSNKISRGSLDILGVRDFYKRLATLFFLKGKKGLIYVHNSMAPIIPAYTFTTSMVQGEEYINTLKDFDYIASSSLAFIRSVYSPDQYGIPTVWLSELWVKPSRLLLSNHSSYSTQNKWLNSPEYKKAYRNFMAVALLHDLKVLSFAPFVEKEAIYNIMDNFGVNNSEFIGYWANTLIKSNNDKIKISYYRHLREKKILIIAANLDCKENMLTISNISKIIGIKQIDRINYRSDIYNKIKALKTNSLNEIIPRKSFIIIEITEKRS